MNTKILHAHLTDSMNNKSTLICLLKNGSIKYVHYIGHGSSGMSLSMSNIQYYKIENGHMKWLNNECLPVENLDGETIEEFRQRIIDKLNNSTVKIEKIVKNKVEFA